MSKTDERSIQLTELQHKLLRSVEDDLRRAQDRQQIVISGIFAVEGIELAEIIEFDEDSRTMRIRVHQNGKPG